MKRLYRLFRRYQSMNKINHVRLSLSSTKVLSNDSKPSNFVLQHMHAEQVSTSFNQYHKSTCDSFTSTDENSSDATMYLVKDSTELFPKMDLSESIIQSINHLSKSISTVETILTIGDFCFWFDLHNLMKDLIDQVLTVEENRLNRQNKNRLTVFHFYFPHFHYGHRQMKQRRNSIAIQTRTYHERHRNVKVQTNTITLSPLPTKEFSCTKTVSCYDSSVKVDVIKSFNQ